MAPQNRALWLKEKRSPLMVVEDAPYNPPDADEVVVETKALAINPCDNAIQHFGILVDRFPAILGEDVAGVVKEAGSNTSLKSGDHVIGLGSPLGDFKHSAFQEYVVLKSLFAKIPNDAQFSDAAVLPLGVTTAASCLFPEGMLGLQIPPNRGQGTLLVWGASSSVGSCGVQLAAAAGYEVFAVAGKHNHEFVQSIGATKCFDQNSPAIVDDIVTALNGKTVVGAYDAISTTDTLPKICEILHKSDGRKFIASVMPGAETSAAHGVEIKNNLDQDLVNSETVKQAWKYLESALAAGSFQYKPTAEIVGHGIEDVQKACDLIGRGVSAKKLVVTV